MTFWEKMRRRIIAGTGIAAGMGVIAFHAWPRPSVDSVMNDFLYNDAHRAEDMLMDPLILHADIVKERVIEKIQDPTMEKRRYAIGFLGVARVEEALPTLRTILADENEKEYFRADAMERIYLISRDEGRSLAGEHSSREGFLGFIAKGLLDGSHEPFQRSYAQALMGHHE